VLPASATPEEMAAPQGRDRAYRASDPDAALARELLDLIEELNGFSADEKLARLRDRLEDAA
jgi:hypothetical protein